MVKFSSVSGVYLAHSQWGFEGFGRAPYFGCILLELVNLLKVLGQQ